MQHIESSGELNMRPYEETTNSFNMLDRLDQIRMSPGERLMAKAYLRQGQLLADFLLRVGADLRRVFGFVARGFDAIARRKKASAISRERNEWSMP
jgi:hypothetical protein